MRTHVEFRSSAFPPIPGEEEEINPGRYGKNLVQFLAAELPRYQVAVQCVSPQDWGWRIDLRNDAFPLWIGCGNYEEYDDGFLCFIEPSRPTVSRWFNVISTVETIEQLATTLECIIRESGKAEHVRWWTEAENARR